MAEKRRRRRREKIGGLGDEEEDQVALALLARGQQEDPNIGLLMQLLKLQEGQGENAADRAFKERQQQAAEFYQGVGRDIEERRLTAGEKEAAEKAIAEDVREGTRQRELGEERAHRTERETKEDAEKMAARVAAEKKQKISDIDTMVERQIITKEEARPYYEKLDPEFAEVTKGIKAQQAEEAFKRYQPEYQKLSPKDKAKALPESFGGPEIYKRILEAEKQAQPAPDLTPKTAEQPGWLSRMFGGGASEPASAVGQGGVWQHQIPQATDFPRSEGPAPQVIPAVGGMTEPVVAPEFTYEEGYPSAMPPEIQQPGVLDNFLQQISEYAASRPDRTPAERYPYPTGQGITPVPLDPRLIGQPRAMPLGYGR